MNNHPMLLYSILLVDHCLAFDSEILKLWYGSLKKHVQYGNGLLHQSSRGFRLDLFQSVSILYSVYALFVGQNGNGRNRETYVYPQSRTVLVESVWTKQCDKIILKWTEYRHVNHLYSHCCDCVSFHLLSTPGWLWRYVCILHMYNIHIMHYYSVQRLD